MKKTKLPTSKLLTKEEALADRKWFLLDAKGKTLGRFASEVSKILRGKHKPDFTPHVDCGDGVIIINANQIAVTGAKEAQKIYYHHTHKSNGLRETPFRVMLDRHPDRIIWEAVKGMMPLSRLGRQQMRKLRIYAGDVHDLQAQQPISLNV